EGLAELVEAQVVFLRNLTHAIVDAVLRNDDAFLVGGLLAQTFIDQHAQYLRPQPLPHVRRILQPALSHDQPGADIEIEGGDDAVVDERDDAQRILRRGGIGDERRDEQDGGKETLTYRLQHVAVRALRQMARHYRRPVNPAQ